MYFYLEKPKNEITTINLIYYLKSENKYFKVSTGQRINPDNWDFENRQPKVKRGGQGIQNSHINTVLLKYKDLLEEAIKEHELSGNPLTKNILKDKFDVAFKGKQEAKGIPTDLINYIDYFIEYKRNDFTSKRSLGRYKVIQSKLRRFEKHRKKTILISEVNDKFKNEFVDYLLAEDYTKNTIQRDIDFVKTICKHARFLGLKTHPQLDTLKSSKEKTEKIYLDFNDLEKIENVELNQSLDNARNWLIISCYTGQRVSDFMRFDTKMIRIEDGKELIEFEQMKTGKLMTVPVHKKVKETLDKLNGFPKRISDQKYNDYIKEVCKKAGLTEKIKGSKMMEVEKGKFRKVRGIYPKYELVSSHIGRRSFATNFYGKIPTTFLIYITGHSTESMFLQYIGKSNKDLAIEIARYF